MSQICFSETRFFGDHFILLRRPHPGPTRPYFDGPKVCLEGAPLTQVYKSSYFLFSLTHCANPRAPAVSCQTLDQECVFPLSSPLDHQTKPLKSKIHPHHLLPFLTSTSLIPFSRRSGHCTSSPHSSFLVSRVQGEELCLLPFSFGSSFF